MGKILIGLVVLVAAVIGLLSWVLSDPNRFKPELLELLQDQTGLNVRIDGDLAWRLWPPVQLLAADVSADWNDPDTDPLVRIRELRLDADLLPLLSASPTLKVDGIRIDGLHANLMQTGNEANWTPPGYDSPPPPIPVPAPDPSASTGWEIGQIVLLDALIDYTQDGEHSRVALASLRLTGLAPDQNIPIAAAARIESGGTTVDLDIGGALRTDPSFTRWQALGLTLKGIANGPVDALPFALRVDADIDSLAGTAELRDGTLELADAPFTFALQATGLLTTPALTGQLELLTQPIPQLLALFDLNLLDAVGLSFNFDANEQRVTLTELATDALGSRASGTATYTLGTSPGTGPRADFELEVDSLVIEQADPVPVALGGPGLIGMVAAAAAPQAMLPSNEPILPLETLRELDWQGSLTIAELMFDGAPFPNTRIETSNQGGVIDAALNMPSFFGGSAASKVNIDARSDEPVWRITPALSNVDSQPLMTWLDQKLYWAALMLADGEFEMHGNTEAALLKSVAGKARFDGGQGTMDITKLKRAVQAVAQLAGGSERINAWPERLDYKRLTGDWRVDGDKHVLDVALDNMALAMNGTYDALADDMDMKIDLTILDDPDMNTFQINSMLMGMAIPVRCKGPSSAPTCRADEAGVQALIADALTGQAGVETTERLDQAIEEKVPEEYQDAARELLKGFGNMLKQTEQRKQQQSQQPQQ